MMRRVETRREMLSMAERTGIPEIDRLIEDFLKEPLGDWTTDDSVIEALRDPVMSHGMCQNVTRQFVDFAKERGFKAYVTDTDINEMGYQITGDPHGEILDNDGNIVPGHYQDHTVASIYLEGRNFPIEIDFTASQYGYTDHPKISQ